MDTWIQDLRWGFRSLGRRPATTAAAVALLGVGVGVTTAIFSLLHAVVLRPLPFDQPEQLVALHSDRQGELGSLSGPEYEALRDGCDSFLHLAAVYQADLNLTGSGPPERVLGAFTTPELPLLLGIEPTLGWGFRAEETVEGRDGVVMISERLARQRFGGAAPSIEGQLILDGRAYTVVGVLPDGIAVPDPSVQVWLPMVFSGDLLSHAGTHLLQVLGRRDPEVAPAAAAAEVRAVLEAASAGFPADHRTHSATGVPLREELIGPFRPGLLLLLGAVGSVLLITCVNLGNLQLVDAERRRGELALRLALGAGRRRLLRQLLTENLLLGVLGGLAGLLLAVWARDLLVALAPAGVPRIETASLDGTVLSFGVALSLLAGLTLGLLPAYSVSRASLRGGLRQAVGGLGGGSRRSSGRRLLISAEVALSLLLLVCAGLLIRSFSSLTGVDPGFDPGNVLTARISLPEERYSDPHTQARLLRELVGEVRTQPGVEEAAVILPLPFSGQQMRLSAEPVDGRERPPGAESPSWRAVSPQLFSVLRIPLLQGRLLEPRDDRPEAPPVVVVNETMARRYWPGEEALGKHLILGYDDLSCEVVGVVGDLRTAGLDLPPREEIYTAIGRTPWPSFALAVRLKPEAVAAGGHDGLLRRVVYSLDPELPIYGVAFQDDLLEGSLAPRRYVMGLVAAFSASALVLAALGIYAVVSYSVSRRTREIGIRKALGATSGEVIRQVLADGLRPVIRGIVVGLLVAVGALGLIRSQLYGVTTRDPATLIGVSLLIAGVAAASVFLPARRAARVDPILALRQDG